MGTVAFSWVMACVVVGGWKIGQTAGEVFSHLRGLYRTRDRSCRGASRAIWEASRRGMRSTYGVDVRWEK